MTFFDSVSLDQIVLALIATMALREVMIAVLPDAVVGPHGWLVRTDDDN